MLNQIILVGRIIEKVEKKEGEKTKHYITIATQRAYKNEKGQYYTDVFQCEIAGLVAEKTNEYCTAGDIIGVKGRLEMEEETPTIKVEKVTVLSNSKRDEKDV